ncbi:MAG TPA: PadR family transcriptional regulator [Steroidobacteraceae bacterium]|nr:PadR family transcriptional regulator [Steroidobacteraceae bacterium]
MPAAACRRILAKPEKSPVNWLTNQVIKSGLRRANMLCRLATMGKQIKNVRISLQTLRVLEAFLENPVDELAGADVQKRTTLASGTLYPILLRLESAGWFVSRWEAVDPAHVGRPRRRLYRLTPSGLARASEVFTSFGRGVPA